MAGRLPGSDPRRLSSRPGLSGRVILRKATHFSVPSFAREDNAQQLYLPARGQASPTEQQSVPGRGPRIGRMVARKRN
jgi:hypothetical protein